MKKVLIIGSEGMAGHLLLNFLGEQSNYILYSTSRNPCKENKNHMKLDVFNTEKLTGFIKKMQPDYVINCVGVLVKDANENPDKAIFINAYFPHFLDKLSKTYGYKLIHISTDCVFDGQKGGYLENDIPNETNFYGRSKALGEVINERNLTIRTSIIGPEIKADGVGLFHWFMSQRGDINGYSKAIWSGVTTLELAKFIHYLLAENIDLTGLFHLCNNDKLSKESLLILFQQNFGRYDINIRPDDSFVCDKSFLNTRGEIQYQVPDYNQMIYEIKQWIFEHQDNLYSQYKVNSSVV